MNRPLPFLIVQKHDVAIRVLVVLFIRWDVSTITVPWTIRSGACGTF